MDRKAKLTGLGWTLRAELQLPDAPGGEARWAELYRASDSWVAMADGRYGEVALSLSDTFGDGPGLDCPALDYALLAHACRALGVL